MTPADRPAFLEVVVGFAELKGKQLSAPALELYWRALAHWDLADFRAAAERLLRTCEFMPTPKEFEDLRRAGEPVAAECWARALAHARALPAVGGYLQEQASGDARLDAIVQTIGGYKAIANAGERDLQFMATRFTENFESVTNAVETRQALPAIASLGKALPYDKTRRLS